MTSQTPLNSSPSHHLVADLLVARPLHDFLEREALPGTGVSAAAFWRGLAGLVKAFAPRNRELLAVRDQL
jgi:malate synthase